MKIRKTLAEQVYALIKECVKPHQYLTFKTFKVCEDIFLTRVILVIYEDAKGVLFARQQNDKFVLPLTTYRKELLGDTYLDNNFELKQPKEIRIYTQTRYANSKEVCSVLDYLNKTEQVL